MNRKRAEGFCCSRSPANGMALDLITWHIVAHHRALYNDDINDIHGSKWLFGGGGIVSESLFHAPLRTGTPLCLHFFATLHWHPALAQQNRAPSLPALLVIA